MTKSNNNAVIVFAPDGYNTNSPKLMGRQAAGEGFLRGFARHSLVDSFYYYTPDEKYASGFKNLIKPFLNNRSTVCITPNTLPLISEIGALYTPDPGIGEHAWQRRRLLKQRLYSICGITHTTASAGSMELITNLVTAPVQPWDALICTSHAVRQNVLQILNAQQDYLKHRVAAQQFVLPQLPVIPLGVETDRFATNHSERMKWRRHFKLSDEDIAVIFVGRLSFHAKAHHVPMYLALEQAALQTNKKITFLMVGWFANEFIERNFRDDINRYCPHVRVEFLDGRKPDIRFSIWQAADIFLSLADNIQETFGLTPIEAMAAKLPVIVSDWDGYRDTVREGIDGFCVPTLCPPSGLGVKLASRFEMGIDNYDYYCLQTSQMVAVDIPACVRALIQLINNPKLRQQMGANGYERARNTYDWSVVIQQYQDLWQELASIRTHATESAPCADQRISNPQHMDPWLLFASYPTQSLTLDHTVQLTSLDNPSLLHSLYQSASTSDKKLLSSIFSQQELEQVLPFIHQPMTLKDLLKHFPSAKHSIILCSLLWLAKYGLLAFSSKTKLVN